MNSRIRLIALSCTMAVAAPLFAQQSHQHHAAKEAATTNAKTGKLVPVTEKDAAWAAKARKEYPLDVCLTSDEKLGSMGKSPEYIYRVDGQPDRLVMFCCDGCEEDFLEEPAKYLAKLDAGKNAEAKGGAKADAEHAGHH